MLNVTAWPSSIRQLNVVFHRVYPRSFTLPSISNNGIHLSSRLLKFIPFADDTDVLFSDLDMLQDILNSELEKVSNCLMADKLTINIKKTMFFFF